MVNMAQISSNYIYMHQPGYICTHPDHPHPVVVGPSWRDYSIHHNTEHETVEVEVENEPGRAEVRKLIDLYDDFRRDVGWDYPRLEEELNRVKAELDNKDFLGHPMFVNPLLLHSLIKLALRSLAPGYYITGRRM